MAGLSELRKHLASAKSTNQMTNAMKTVAVSKYNRTLQRYEAFRPYMDCCSRFLKAAGGGGISRKDDKRGRTYYVLVAGNRGLCGSFNADLLRYFRENREEGSRVIACGKWLAGRIEGADERAISDVPDPEMTDGLARELLELYVSGEAERVVLVYQQFKNMLVHEPVSRTFLPVEFSGEKDTDYLVLPEGDGLREEFTQRCLRAQLYGAFLSGAAACHSATLTAMRTAADNSEEMIKSLETRLNRMRQSSVTTELLDILGGSSYTRG